MVVKNQQHFELGVTLKDTVTGFTGIAIARLEHLNGCVHYGVKPKQGKDGKLIEAEYIDSQQLEQVDDGLNEQSKKRRTNTGGSLDGTPRL